MSTCKHCGREMGPRYTPMSGWVAVPCLIGWLTILYVLMRLTGAT